MATVHIVHDTDVQGITIIKRPNEPYPRPWVALQDGTTMTYLEWQSKGKPN
jgi:hypothetical protein